MHDLSSASGSQVNVSPYNLHPEVCGEANWRSEIIVHDSTLRDGEQTIGLALSPDEKLEIALALEAAGVGRIEAGMPVVSPDDFAAVRGIAASIRKAEVWGFSRCLRSDIDANVEAGVTRVICEIATSPHKLRAYGMSTDSMRVRLVDSVRYAKELGLYVAFFAVDATRTPLKDLREAYVAAVEEAGADEVVVVDTLGVTTPEAFFWLVKEVMSWVQVPVGVHCHNDFGLATACSLAGLRAGAACVHVTVNGLGEKTGNADLAEVVLGAELLYGVRTGVAMKSLKGLSELVERVSGLAVWPLKPVVGRTVFQRESGVTVAQLLRYPPAVEGYAPEIVGREREILLGKKSGTASVEYFLAKVGAPDLSREQVAEVLQRVKQASALRKRVLSQQEFAEIVAQVVAGKS